VSEVCETKYVGAIKASELSFFWMRSDDAFDRSVGVLEMPFVVRDAERGIVAYLMADTDGAIVVREPGSFEVAGKELRSLVMDAWAMRLWTLLDGDVPAPYDTD
jgi:hypothetical protein